MRKYNCSISDSVYKLERWVDHLHPTIYYPAMDPLLSFNSSEYLTWAKPVRAELDSTILELQQHANRKQEAGDIVVLSDLYELEYKLGQRFQLLESAADALERINLNRRALNLAQDTKDPKIVVIMMRLAEALLDRFSSTKEEAQEAAWLDEAIELGRKAVSLLDHQNPQALVATCIVGSALCLRHTKLRDIKDLEEAISLHTLVTDDSHSSHPQFYWFISKLGQSYLEEHRRSFEPSSIEKSERLYLQAMEECLNQSNRWHLICRQYARALFFLARTKRSKPLAHKALHLLRELAQFYRTFSQIPNTVLSFLQGTCMLLGDLDDDPHFWSIAMEYAQEIVTLTTGVERTKSQFFSYAAKVICHTSHLRSKLWRSVQHRKAPALTDEFKVYKISELFMAHVMKP